jgi:mRNA interferase MazF
MGRDRNGGLAFTAALARCPGKTEKALKREPRHGEVYFVALDPVVGKEIRKNRPAVVISNDSCNTYDSRVVVLPVTGNVDSLYPGEARIQLRGAPARVLGDQIRSIDKSRLRSKIGVLSQDELLDVELAVQVTLALRSS